MSLGSKPLPDHDVCAQKVRLAAQLDANTQWILYPVRGIRRKNIGEFCLLSMLMPEHAVLGVTLPPTTAIEAESYLRWKAFAQTYAPRAVFDAGTWPAVPFLENLAASRRVVSTSVAEGFGMAFLEPWLAGRGVVARRLPGVVDDFEENGLQLDRFYDGF